jgi:hypothetical protein
MRACSHTRSPCVTHPSCHQRRRCSAAHRAAMAAFYRLIAFSVPSMVVANAGGGVVSAL